MKIEITLSRNRPKVGGGVTIVNFDQEFTQKLEDFVEKEANESPTMNIKDSAYYDLRKGYDTLTRALERILPQETEKPFQVVINVEGEVDNSPGWKLY